MIAEILVFAGCLVVVFACTGAVLARSLYVRLHYLTPVTSLAGPLIGLGLAVDAGWGLTAGLEALIVALLAATGPILESATGRVVAQREGRVSNE
jgi:multisubunit Na+/H+ antiporter MnhG subunit